MQYVKIHFQHPNDAKRQQTELIRFAFPLVPELGDGCQCVNVSIHLDFWQCLVLLSYYCGSK